MMKVIPALLIVGCLAGCAANGEPRVNQTLAATSSCGDKRNLTVTVFAYDESLMSTKSRSDIKPESGFYLRLRPRRGYDDAMVTVTGTSSNAGWINGSGSVTTMSDDLLFVGCAPAAPINAEYKYEIKVEKGSAKNLLDPRARLIR